ncbi:aminotransferase class V-fold PLP-dependent enzyme [Streptomyces monticola]|uniref:Aminotransferase class V-fold PLP-dependent enzyme n=1 Tax=Streptomyces monticola TaxID=2666263 RepID=A0ABW2JZ74_9ACTN
MPRRTPDHQIGTHSSDFAKGFPMHGVVTNSEFQSCIQREFPAVRNKAYLDSACIGVAPFRAVRAVTDLAQGMQYCIGESGTEMHGRLNVTRAAAHPMAARLIGAEPSDIALVESATQGLKIAAEALPLKAGDHVLVPDLEFVQMGLMWRQMEARGVTVRAVPHAQGRISVDAVRAQLTPEVKVLAISSVQWTNGFRVDLASISELCRQREIWLVVDAAQHLGSLALNVKETPVDILVCGGHKWLCSPFGSGFMYLSPKARPQLRRPLAGFFSAKPPARTWGEAFLRTDITPFQEYEFTGDASAWETGGTGNYPGAVGLAASLSVIHELRPQRIQEHIHALADYLLEGLDRLGIETVSPRAVEDRSGIVTFRAGNAAADQTVLRTLLAAGVAVSMRYISGVGGIRVSCHHYNTLAHIDQLLEAVEKWQHRPTRPRPARAEAEGSDARLLPPLVTRQRALIDALDDDLMGLITARNSVARGIRLGRLAGALPRTDLAREREVIERFHQRLGQDGTRLALELLRTTKGNT